MVSLQDVANHIGVSRNTVSKVINEKSGVTEKTRKLVMDAALELGYNKMPIAQKVQNNIPSGMNISVVVTNPKFSNFWMRIINSISHELHQEDNNLVYNFILDKSKTNFKIPEIILKKEVSGIVVLNVYSDYIIHALAQTDLPIVYYDVPVNVNALEAKGDILLLEGYFSMIKITRNIIEQGITDIGFLGDTRYARTIYDRYQGFKDAMASMKIPINKEWCLTKGTSNNFYDKGEVEKALDQIDKMPRAFVCANDELAYALIQYVREKGYKVPEDIMVSGYDNIESPISEQDFLTTVDVDNEYLGKRLTQILYDRINVGKDIPYEIIKLTTNVIFRGSTKNKNTE